MVASIPMKVSPKFKEFMVQYKQEKDCKFRHGIPMSKLTETLIEEYDLYKKSIILEKPFKFKMFK